MNNSQNQQSVADQAVNAGVAVIAAASKTPFKTSFYIVFGMGLARLALTSLFMLSVAILYLVLKHAS